MNVQEYDSGHPIEKRSQRLFQLVSQMNEDQFEQDAPQIVDVFGSLQSQCRVSCTDLLRNQTIPKQHAESLAQMQSVISSFSVQTRQQLLESLMYVLGFSTLLQRADDHTKMRDVEVSATILDSLTHKQRRAFDVLRARPRIMVTNYELYKEVYEKPLPQKEESILQPLRTIISRVRKVIQHYGTIESVHSQGYRWTPLQQTLPAIQKKV